MDKHLGFHKLKLPEFFDYRHIKAARLSALSTGNLYHTPLRVYLWYLFSLEFESTLSSQFGWKVYVNKNPNDPTGNQAHIIPVCSAVSEPTAPRVHNIIFKLTVYFQPTINSSELKVRSSLYHIRYILFPPHLIATEFPLRYPRLMLGSKESHPLSDPVIQISSFCRT